MTEIERVGFALYGINFYKWPPMYSKLNSFEWPDELGDPPAGWGEMADEEKHKNPTFRYVFREIEDGCGEKMLLRQWHREEFGASDTQFDDWWEGMKEREEREQRERLEKSRKTCSRFVNWGTVAGFLVGGAIGEIILRAIGV